MGAVLQRAPKGTWVTVADFSGDFSFHPEFQGEGGSCGSEADCGPDSTPLLLFPDRSHPLRVICSGEMEVVKITAFVPNLEDEPEWECAINEPFGQELRYGHTGITLFSPDRSLSFAIWSLIMERRPDGSLVREGKYSALVQVWKGPWREPFCGEGERSVPRGFWNGCAARGHPEARWSSVNPPPD